VFSSFLTFGLIAIMPNNNSIITGKTEAVKAEKLIKVMTLPPPLAH
jgi:hypothetical protein